MRSTAKLVTGWASALAVASGLGATPAGADPRPGTGKRDVIAEAEVLCAGMMIPGPLATACDLLADTNGGQDLTTQACTEAFDGVDNGILDYRFRNCDRNEEALLRKVAGSILALDDYLARGKEPQKETAAGYLCSYADKFMLLEGADKLLSTEDLAADAQNLAEELVGEPCP